jgi:hypothetical protein
MHHVLEQDSKLSSTKFIQFPKAGVDISVTYQQKSENLAGI